MHYPLLNRNKPGMVRRVLNGASKVHDTFFDMFILLAQISFLYFQESARINTPFQPKLKGCFYRLEYVKKINVLYGFCGHQV